MKISESLSNDNDSQTSSAAVNRGLSDREAAMVARIKISENEPLQRHEHNTLLPEMPIDQFRRLKEAVREQGLLMPILLCDGKVLDGWQRYQICRQLRIEPRFEKSNGKNPLLECFSLNAARRHLKPSQLAILANEMTERLKKQHLDGEDARKAASDDRNGTGEMPHGTHAASGAEVKAKMKQGKTRTAVAKALGVSEGNIQNAKKLKATAPDLYAKVRAGSLNLNQAHRQARGRVYRAKEVAAKDTSSILVHPTGSRVLHNCDILAAPIEDESLDAIITDPPYPKEYLDCWSKLGRFAARKLKPGGILLAMSGIEYLPEVLRNLTVDGLSYHWTLCYGMPEGGSCPRTQRVGCHWKPVLWFVKGKYERTYQATDLFVDQRANSDEGKLRHKWGQSLPFFKELVEKFTYANELVCDPFAGSSTTGIACLSLKRRFVGVEIDPEAYATSQKRFSEWKPEPTQIAFKAPEVEMSIAA